jgi:hypothetical protein
MHVKQQWVNWTYLEKHPGRDVQGHGMEKGYVSQAQLECEAVIRQFYATLEVRMDKERLFWMTGTMLHSFQC